MMHARLTDFKSDRVITDEGSAETDALVPRAGSGKRGKQGGSRIAQQMMSDVKRRSLRVDSLGPEPERRKKAQALDVLMRAGGGDGLAPEILALQPPRVLTFDAAAGPTSRAAAAATERWGSVPKRPRR
jgi:hypothetical protein